MAPDIDILTDNEKLLFKTLQEGSFDEVKNLISCGDININCLDDHGMTPLQHAAYRGNFELCKLFIDSGADVNSHYHESGYTALTFAGLAGKLNVVSLFLEHGASTTVVNSVGRTAAQMAAFVGNHEVVSIINNFIPREDINYYTEVHGLETEPKLPVILANQFHHLVIKTNIHPVRIAMFLQSNKSLLEEAKKVICVLELLCEKQLKSNTNELLSLKFHHLAYVVRACDRFYFEHKTKVSKKQSAEPKGGLLEPLIKRWIKGRDGDGFPEVLEKLLRQSIREYPFMECALFQQLVHTLAPVNIGDEPSAVSILSQAVSGQRGINDGPVCSTCGEPKAEKRCAACKSVQYCDQSCQKLHWFTHKINCSLLAEKYKNEQQSSETCNEKEPNKPDTQENPPVVHTQEYEKDKCVKSEGN